MPGTEKDDKNGTYSTSSDSLQLAPVANQTTALRSQPSKLETFDDMLPYVGDFGKYQWCLLSALLPYSMAYATLYFSQFFLTIVPYEHWCRLDDLTVANFSQEERIKAAIPASRDYPYYDQCVHKKLNFTSLLKGSRDYHSPAWMTNETQSCDKWEYNFTEIPYASIGAELDWVCDREYLLSTAQAIFFCGSVVGGFLFGYVADHKGRNPALVYCSAVALVASIVTASCNSFWSFAVCRFFTGLAFDNCINIPLIIVVEYVAVKRRTLVVNIAFGLYFAIASTLLPWVAYYVANWRHFAYISAIPLLLSLLTPWILPESSRWYVSNGKIDKVLEKLRRISRFNRKNPDPRIYDIFERNMVANRGKKEAATLLDLFKTPRMARNTILMILFWALTIVAFDGHVYALKLLHESVFVSFSLACATELPAGLVLTLILDRWGRRFCGFITLTATFVFTVIELVLSPGAGRLAMSISSRFCLNMTANIGLQYAAELLPTPVRAQGVALIHIFGIMAHSVAPYIIDSAHVWSGLPMVIIAATCFLNATLVLFLPETLGRDMPQTLEEGEEFGKDQSFWKISS